MSATTIGIDIGGTKTSAAVVTRLGKVLSRVTAPTPADQGAAAVLDTAAELVRRLAPVPPFVIGVGAAGTIDPVTGVVRYATNSLPGWRGTRVVDELQGRLNQEVKVANDVNVALLGEAWVGAAKGHSDALLIAVGTGLGAGILHASRVFRGSRGAAGEIAHLVVPGADLLRCGCGAFGHLEAVASGAGLANAYAAQTGVRVSGADVASRASSGDSAAQGVVQHAGDVLGRAIAGLVAVLDCSIVVIAGGAGPAVFPCAEAAFRAELLPAYRDTPLVLSSLAGDAVVVGAARLAMEAAR